MLVQMNVTFKGFVSRMFRARGLVAHFMLPLMAWLAAAPEPTMTSYAGSAFAVAGAQA